jgi:hypothetical protein
VHESGGVQLTVSIDSQLYVYVLTNVDAPDIDRFEIACHATYNHEVPRGWEFEYDYEDGVLTSWTTDRRQMIRPGESRRFTARVSSTGAVLGAVDATITPAEGEPITIEDIWGPVHQPRGILVLIPTTIAVIGLFHACLVARSDRKRGVTRH